MSRGPGRWQRALLAALDEYDLVPVADVVHHEVADPARSDLVAARRAARRIAEVGKARAVYLWGCVSCHDVDSWAKPCCGRRTPVLVLTRDESVRSVGGVGKPPPWISVAGASKRQPFHSAYQATHKGVRTVDTQPAVSVAGGSNAATGNAYAASYVLPPDQMPVPATHSGVSTSGGAA